MTRAGDALRAAAATLAAAGIDQPAREARLLLAHLLGRPPNALIDRETDIDAGAYDALLARRAAHEPMAYIVGRAGFWTLDLAVSPATLIPRADSEAVIEAVLTARPDREAPARILDLGTGTGCLLLACLTEYAAATGVGTDRIEGAAALARANARDSGLASRAMFVVGDWAAPIAGPFDVVVCNPPYIERDAVARLMPDVSLFEPASALDGGIDGLECYRAVLREGVRLVGDDGVIVVEIGATQAAAVTAIARDVGLDVRALRRDVGGRDRAITLTRRVAEKRFGTARA